MPRFHLGDLVYAAMDLYNDALEDSGESAIPGRAPGDLLVPAGTRGVVVNVGEVEAQPGTAIYLVRWESSPGGSLSEPIGCLAEELRYGED